MPDDIEYNGVSLALKNCPTHDTHWAFLRFLFESYSPRSLLQAPAQSFKQSVMTEGLLWDNLAHQTFESSDKHFCLWHAFRGNVNDMVSVAPGSIMATGGLFDKANAVNLLLFFKNCIALEEKNALNKPAKKQNSL